MKEFMYVFHAVRVNYESYRNNEKKLHLIIVKMFLDIFRLTEKFNDFKSITLPLLCSGMILIYKMNQA